MDLVEHFMNINKIELKDAIIKKDDFLKNVRLLLNSNNLNEACNICDENCIELNDIILQL